VLRVSPSGCAAGLGILAFGASVILVSSFGITESGAQARPEMTPAWGQVEPAGENFTIHTSVDPNFCFTDIPQDGRPSSIAQCIVNDEMRFAFAETVDDTSVIIDGSGQCLQVGKKPNDYATFKPCTFLTPEQFVYKNSGQLESVSGKLCLQDAQAAQNAAVSFSPCAKGLGAQIWQLGH
jgi:Ricin-type beta-trefoil lectin domain